MKIVIWSWVFICLGLNLNSQVSDSIDRWGLKIESWSDHENDIQNPCEIKYNDSIFSTTVTLLDIDEKKIKLIISLTINKNITHSYRHTINSKNMKNPTIHDPEDIAGAIANSLGESDYESFLKNYLKSNYSRIKFTKIE